KNIKKKNRREAVFLLC
ncbi:putative thiol peroxidase, partial [Haemophilus influenzae]